MVDDYRSVKIPIVWSHSVLPTPVLVDRFLQLELSIFLYFWPSRSQIKLNLSQTLQDQCLFINGEVMCVGTKIGIFLDTLCTPKWKFKLNLNQTCSKLSFRSCPFTTETFIFTFFQKLCKFILYCILSKVFKKYQWMKLLGSVKVAPY